MEASREKKWCKGFERSQKSGMVQRKNSIVPGMAMHNSQSQDLDMNSDAGTAKGSPGGESFSTAAANFSTNGDVTVSTSAVNQAELSQSLDRAQESTNKKLDFLPATR